MVNAASLAPRGQMGQILPTYILRFINRLFKIHQMPRAKVGVVMLSEAFFKSGPCKEELLALIKKGHPIIPVVFDMSAHKAKKGDTFLGTDPDSIEDANFLKTKMTGNSLPPPYQGVFLTNFDVNAAELVRLVKRELASRGLIKVGLAVRWAQRTGR